MKSSAAFPIEIQENLQASHGQDSRYREAIAEFDFLWESNQSRNAEARMDELLEIIEVVEQNCKQQAVDLPRKVVA